MFVSSFLMHAFKNEHSVYIFLLLSMQHESIKVLLAHSCTENISRPKLTGIISSSQSHHGTKKERDSQHPEGDGADAEDDLLRLTRKYKIRRITKKVKVSRKEG